MRSEEKEKEKRSEGEEGFPNGAFDFSTTITINRKNRVLECLALSLSSSKVYRSYFPSSHFHPPLFWIYFFFFFFFALGRDSLKESSHNVFLTTKVVEKKKKTLIGWEFDVAKLFLFFLVNFFLVKYKNIF